MTETPLLYVFETEALTDVIILDQFLPIIVSISPTPQPNRYVPKVLSEPSPSEQPRLFRTERSRSVGLPQASASCAQGSDPAGGDTLYFIFINRWGTMKNNEMCKFLAKPSYTTHTHTEHSRELPFSHAAPGPPSGPFCRAILLHAARSWNTTTHHPRVAVPITASRWATS